MKWWYSGTEVLDGTIGTGVPDVSDKSRGLPIVHLLVPKTSGVLTCHRPSGLVHHTTVTLDPTGKAPLP